MAAAPGRAHHLAGELGARDPQAVERITLALVDLPLSLVRRHLRDGGRYGGGLPAHAEELAEDCAAALLETAR
ncbi:hypothetical protein [Streptomyces sp. NBC_01795]|uniref:hypothetical protein n=1 Tax=Streptomyces sp. NBC_01795 TaxID=2975943 RepID=UPI003FA3A33A